MQKTQDIQLLQKRIEKELSALKLPPEPKTLYEPIAYTLASGGKRMRPVLLLLGCKLFGGNTKKAIGPAIGIEMFHNFTLIHDDIMDRAPFRRNRQSVHQKWNTNVALLSGDVMQVLAYTHLFQCDKSVLPAITKVFNETAVKVCEGQQIDMNFETRDDVTIDEYINMIGLKTAALLAGALKIGAIIGKAGEEDADGLYEFGRHMGIAFQLQDDLLDVFGNPEKFGKQVGGDLIANKKTYLLLKAMDMAGNKKARQLRQLINGPDKGKVEAVKKIYAELGVKEATKAEMAKHFDHALKTFATINANESRKQLLLSFAKQLMAREI